MYCVLSLHDNELPDMRSGHQWLLLVRALPEGALLGHEATGQGFAVCGVQYLAGPRQESRQVLPRKGGGLMARNVRAEVWLEASKFCSDVATALSGSIDRVEVAAGGPCRQSVAWPVIRS